MAFAFKVSGTVSEVRALEVKDKSRIWGVSVKVATEGLTCELMADEALFKSLGVVDGKRTTATIGAGMMVECTGIKRAGMGGEAKDVVLSIKPIDELAMLKARMAELTAAAKPSA